MRNPSRRFVFVAAVAAVLVAVLVGGFALLRRHGRLSDGSPASVHRAWTTRGVERPNLVLVTLDTTRADHLGCYGDAAARTPSLDALAASGVLFEQAATVAPLTLPAHCSIHTGTYPTHHGVRLNGVTALSPSALTLAEVFSGKGYDTAAFIAAFVLDGRWGLKQGFSHYDDRFDLGKYKNLDLGSIQRPGNVVMDAALGWLEEHRKAPFFTWIHLYDAHSPYEPPEPLRSEFGGRGLAGLYDGEIAFADQQVGRLTEWLRRDGLDQRTIVVVVGDHGEGLGSHGEGTHGYFVYDSVLRVPFIVATPFQELRGVRVSSQVSTVDLFPTVLALSGIDVPAGVEGRALLGPMLHPGEGRTSYAYGESMTPQLQFGWAALSCLRTPRWKYVLAPRPELYDLVADPGEQANVVARHAAVADEMRGRLDRLVAETSRDAATPEAADLDRQTIASLAALGYVGTTAAPRADASHPPADPKDKLAAFSAVQQAGEQIVHDEYAEAAAVLEAALRDEPSMPQARLMLGTAYSELGRRPEAKAQFDLVLKDDPRSVQALIGVANLLMQEGRNADVVALCKRTLSLDERNTQAYTLLGEVYAGSGRPAEALPNFEKAAEIQPKLTQNRLNLAGALVELKQYQRGEALLKEIVRDYPQFPLAQYNLGLLYEEQGRLAPARAAYEAEVAAYPRHFRARFNLGKLLFALGDRRASLDEMREVVRIAPELPEGHLFLARGLLHEQASLDEVQAEVEKGLSVARTAELRTLGWLLLADVWNRRGRPDKANEALGRASAHSPAALNRESPHGTRMD